MKTLTIDERERALAGLQDWRFDADRKGIARSFAFPDFAAAFAFMTRVALLAERIDHHPAWSNAWNKVDMLLTTHDAGGLTQRDVDFATAVDGWARDSLS